MNKSQVIYLITQRVVCDRCSGYGDIVHTAWEAYWRENEEELSAEKMAEWFRARGYETLPPNQAICHECDGKGYFESVVNLEDALIDLGLLSKQ